MNYWLVKSEPTAYSWEQLQKDRKVVWEGVRNYAARNNLRAMKKDDLVYFYHSNIGLSIVGIAKVSKEHYPDPSGPDQWSAVDLVPYKNLKHPVSLARIKADAELKNMALLRLTRLSVSPVSKTEFERIRKLSEAS
jgi:predicted RNA-binding protein with PUA-like domain